MPSLWCSGGGLPTQLIFTIDVKEHILRNSCCTQVLPVGVGCTHCGTFEIPQVVLGEPKPEALDAYRSETYGEIAAYVHQGLEAGVWRVEIAGWGRWKSLFLEKAEG